MHKNNKISTRRLPHTSTIPPYFSPTLHKSTTLLDASSKTFSTRSDGWPSPIANRTRRKRSPRRTIRPINPNRNKVRMSLRFKIPVLLSQKGGRPTPSPNNPNPTPTPKNHRSFNKQSKHNSLFPIPNTHRPLRFPPTPNTTLSIVMPPNPPEIQTVSMSSLTTVNSRAQKSHPTCQQCSSNRTSQFKIPMMTSQTGYSSRLRVVAIASDRQKYCPISQHSQYGKHQSNALIRLTAPPSPHQTHNSHFGLDAREQQFAGLPLHLFIGLTLQYFFLLPQFLCQFVALHLEHHTLLSKGSLIRIDNFVYPFPSVLLVELLSMLHPRILALLLLSGLQLFLAYFLLGSWHTFRPPFHPLGHFEVGLSDPTMVDVGVGFLVLPLLLDESDLDLLPLVLVYLGPVLLPQFHRIHFLPLLHFLHLLPLHNQFLLPVGLLIPECLFQPGTALGRTVLPPTLPPLRPVLAPAQVALLMLPYGLDVVSHVEVPDFLEFLLPLLEGGQQYLGLVLLLHLLIESGLVLGRDVLGLQFVLHFEEGFVLLLTLPYGLLDPPALPLPPLLLLHRTQGLPPLFLLPPPALLLGLQFLHPLPPLLLLGLHLPHPPLVLLLAQHLLEIHLKIPTRLTLSPYLPVEVLDLLGNGLSLGLALQLPHLLTRETQGSAFCFLRQGRWTLSRDAIT